MKTVFSVFAALMMAGSAFAGGTGNHAHDQLEVGQPGQAADVTRTIGVRMIETDEGEYLYDPRDIEVAAGETVRFEIVNEGDGPHEFVLDTRVKNSEHMKVMAEFPEMEHDDPNAIRLEPGQKGEIIWKFASLGTFEFACLMPGHYEAGMQSPVVVQ